MLVFEVFSEARRQGFIEYDIHEAHAPIFTDSTFRVIRSRSVNNYMRQEIALCKDSGRSR